MPSIEGRLSALLLALIFVLFCCLEGWSATGESTSPPEAVTDAIAGSPAPASPTEVLVGAYINDIQQIDFKNNNYIIDLYVWFRWTNPDLNPSRTMEFMNRFASDDNRRDDLYDEPQKMPDGSLYAIVRYQGLFSTKFHLGNYPFDTQRLRVLMEDTVSGIGRQVYAPDGTKSVAMNPDLTLPGFSVGRPAMLIAENTYPTNFGDLSQAKAETYSRIALEIPVSRPALPLSLKTFGPILLIVACSSFVFFIRPRYVEGRLGLGITALLTLVALQLTSGASLPDVDYLTMLDKMFLLAYLFIILTLGRVVLTSWRGTDKRAETAIARGDHVWAAMLLTAYFVANLLIIVNTLA
ncbi:MAG: hypothetical protein FJX44_03535 [Alphaproteobacteria bacterium]|nr:hypothetical protein [Alphaproteobacteria bacterium]